MKLPVPKRGQERLARLVERGQAFLQDSVGAAPRAGAAADRGPLRDEVEGAFAIFVVADNACTRCSVCVERCPSDCLYYARLPEGEGGRRTMGAVPMAQQQDADVE